MELDKEWKALERLRKRAAGGNAADEDCNILNNALRRFEADNTALREELDVAVNMDLEVGIRQALEAKLSKMEEALEDIAVNAVTLDIRQLAKEALAGGEEA